MNLSGEKMPSLGHDLNYSADGRRRFCADVRVTDPSAGLQWDIHYCLVRMKTVTFHPLTLPIFQDSAVFAAIEVEALWRQ